MTADAMAGVYGGLEVLDLSTGIAGPMVTMLLADNGARVTRVVPPGGDPFARQAGYRVWNRRKRSVEIDLKCSDGQKAFRGLAGRADVVVESYSPGTAKQLGVDHAVLTDKNPGLITCSITGYGSLAGHAERPGYDALVAARTGLLYDQRGRRGGAFRYITGHAPPADEFDAPDGLARGAARRGPVFPRSPFPSIGAAYLASLGIAAALRVREIAGVGQHVETSLLQGALAAVALNWQRVEEPDAGPYWMWPIDSRSIEGLYECADGRWVHHWTVRPRWVLSAAESDDPREVGLESAYRDDPDRISMDEDGFLAGVFLQPLLADAFKKFPASVWVEAGERAGVGMAPVRSPAEALSDASFIADGCVAEVDDPEVGRIRCVGRLLEFSVATPPLVSRRRAPARSPAHPLSGIRVLDLGLGVAGPFTGRMLADLGADVIKVMAMHDGFWAGTHMGLGTNRGKRSIAVNLKHTEGRAILDRLIERADVLTLNWRPGAADRLGLGFEALHARRPDLVYCNTRGYEKGARSTLPGTDQTAAALVGAEWEDGGCDSGNPPLWSRSNMGDTGNALLAAIAITAALYHRERTGEGQAVSTSIVNAGLLHTSYAWVRDDGTSGEWGRVDRDGYGLAPWYRMYLCADQRWVFVAAVEQAARKRLADLAGCDDALAGLERAFAARPALTWRKALDDAGVPAEVVDEEFCRRLFDDENARAGQLISETWAPGVGRFEDPGLLLDFSSTPGVIERGPCGCGEHTREILAEHGYTATEIDGFVTAKTVIDAPVERPCPE
jgi:crotonobetainyl-CoA:carnitine CoA-transferase CaiB-like acyl-CoA transferase